MITCFYFILDDIEVISIDSGDDAEPLATGEGNVCHFFVMGMTFKVIRVIHSFV